MSCPYLKEVVMLYCGACPIKKMIPLDRLVSASPCLAPNYNECRIFLELQAKSDAAPMAAPQPGRREAQ